MFLHILRIFCLILLSSPVLASSSYDLEVSKSEQMLKVVQGDQVVKQYHMAFGKGGNDSKRHQGDKKTPTGIYTITGFKEDSKFHYFMQLNYPNLIDAWHGYINNLISATEFKLIATAHSNKETPPQNTSLGGYIGIHGIGETTREKLDIHNIHNWTEGCIALKNNEISELRRYVSQGTRVIIKE